MVKMPMLTSNIYSPDIRIFLLYISFILSLRKKGGKCAKDVRFKQDDLNSSPGKPYPISL